MTSSSVLTDNHNVAVALKFGEEKSIRLARKYEATVEILRHYVGQEPHRRNKTNRGKPVHEIECELCSTNVTGKHLRRSYNHRIHLACRDAAERAVRQTEAALSRDKQGVNDGKALEPVSV